MFAPRRLRPPHPLPYVRDDRETPLCVGRDGEGYAGDLRRKGMKIFLRKGLDTDLLRCPTAVPLGRMRTFPHGGLILMLQQNPEDEHMRDQQRRHKQSRNEIGGAQLPRLHPVGIALVESPQEIG
jgi:hypothetical protein